MSKTDVVETVAKARALSLIKWVGVQTSFIKLFNEIDSACGFCDLGRKRAGPEGPKCDHCGVDTRCQAIQDVTRVLEGQLEKVIDGTLSFLEDMDVTEK